MVGNHIFFRYVCCFQMFFQRFNTSYVIFCFQHCSCVEVDFDDIDLLIELEEQMLKLTLLFLGGIGGGGVGQEVGVDRGEHKGGQQQSENAKRVEALETQVGELKLELKAEKEKTGTAGSGKPGWRGATKRPAGVKKNKANGKPKKKGVQFELSRNQVFKFQKGSHANVKYSSPKKMPKRGVLKVH